MFFDKHQDNVSPTNQATREGGFSLIELLTGLAIVSILVGAALPVYSSYTVSVRESSAKARIHQIAMALEQFYAEQYSYQADPEELEIPDSDKWFQYNIINPDRYSYRITAIPDKGQRQTTTFMLDHLGREYFRPVQTEKWRTGWP